MSFNNERENQDKWQNDPDNWIWGFFYYNPEDSRLFPPKRIKQLGWTLNFANPNAVFLVIVLIAIAFIFS
ncbi:hypothetical protein D3C85_1656860 [compost metagenome]